MKKEELFDIIGEVDEQKVAAGMAMNKKKNNRSGWLKWGAMAACLCLVVAGIHLAQNPSTPYDDVKKPVIELESTDDKEMDTETLFPTEQVPDTSDKPVPSDIEDQPADEDGIYHENPAGNLPSSMENIFCGSYIDSKGQFVVVLIEDTPQNRSTVCKELGIKEKRVSFQTGTYTLQYLSELQSKISEGMVQKDLPFVVTSSVNEISNRITISVTTDDETLLKKVLSLDTIGGAIEIQVSEGEIKEDIAVLE